jgi:uncharacterized membrane protein (UPF0127 family)
VRRFWVVILIVVASACGNDTPADDAGESDGGATRPTEATASSVAVAPATPPESSVPVPDDTAPDNAAPDSAAPDETPTDVPGVVPRGFGTIAALVTASDGEICELCLWLAADPASRSRGLMQVTDLGGLDGMAFLYDSPHTTSFTMRNTVMPLSIAFFGAEGGLLGAFDMEPCVAEPCPSYPTPADFLVAIEAPQGGLSDLGIDAGSTLALLAEGCEGSGPSPSVATT